MSGSTPNRIVVRSLLKAVVEAMASRTVAMSLFMCAFSDWTFAAQGDRQRGNARKVDLW